MKIRLARLVCAVSLAVAMASSAQGLVPASCTPGAAAEHGGGLNACGCHFDRKTGLCHCHRPRACGCECQPATCL